MSSDTNPITPTDTAADRQEPERHIGETDFWNTVCHDVFGPRQGGAIIFMDAENARKGVAKTSGAVALARLFAKAFGYDLKKEDFTLSGGEYLKRYQEHPGHEQPSVLVLDEFVGAGSGDKRRSMAQQNVDFGSAWQLLRTKRVVTFATLPDWNEADKRLKKLADYRIWLREEPIGSFQSYKITVPFNAGGGGNVRTKGLGYGEGTTRIHFPNMDANNCPYYRHLSKKKDDLIHSDTWDADDLTSSDDNGDDMTPEQAERRQAVATAIRLYQPWADEPEASQERVGDAVGYSDTWVGNRVREWKNGDYRDIVPDPTVDKTA
ncbi:hypothetical protein [Haloarcula sp. CBA1127]|uniref:hypothetical protein n=1 Tax=Haloarcula sp. CBA1127 TaxID=1765055 RepID=UPI00073F6DA4|nr:hypothetical protein [Haloarcula sp. CBA1127]